MSDDYIGKTSGIGMRDKIGYAMGDVGSLMVFGLVQSVLQKYCTDVLQIGVLSVMSLFIVARIWDAINDPIWGRIVDSVKPRPDGRYRHWIRVFCVPVGLSAVLMFVNIPGMSVAAKTVWVGASYILFGMLYTCVNIPYGSMAQVITTDEKERAQLSVFRSVGSIFGAIPALALISLCYVKTDAGTSVMSYQKIIVGVCIIACLSVLAYMLCYRWSKERVHAQPAPKQSVKVTLDVLRGLATSRPYVAVCLVGMCYLAAQLFAQSYYTYLFNYYFNAPQLSFAPTVCQYLPVAIVMFFAVKLTRRFAKRDICSLGVLIAGLSNLALYLLGGANVWLFVGVCLVTGVGNAFMFLLMWALMMDAVDYTTVTRGIRDDATSYACFTFMRKLGQTVAAILVNASLLRIGYVDNVLNVANITQDVLNTMYSDAVLIPAVLYLIIFLLLRFVYPLGKRQLADLQEKKEAFLKKTMEQ